MGSVVCAALPLVSLAFRALLHSLALCPCPPQYRQRPCAIRRSRSVCVSPPCVVRWQAMVGLPGESWVDEVVDVAGTPGMVLHTLAEAVPRLVLLPWLLRVSQQISACRSQYCWSMFWTRCFQSLKATGSSTSASESFMRSGSTCLSRWQSARSPQLTWLDSMLNSTRKSANF